MESLESAATEVTPQVEVPEGVVRARAAFLRAFASLLADRRTRGAVRERGQRLELRTANLWVHANESGSRDRLADRPPVLLRNWTGIAVYPGNEFP